MSGNFMTFYSILQKLTQFEMKKEESEKEECKDEDDATKTSFACRETKWSVKNNNR